MLAKHDVAELVAENAVPTSVVEAVEEYLLLALCLAALAYFVYGKLKAHSKPHTPNPKP